MSRAPQIVICLILSALLGLAAWWGVRRLLLPEEQRVFLPNSALGIETQTSPTHYWLSWDRTLWHDPTGRYVGVPLLSPYSIHQLDILLFDFQNPESSRRFEIPEAMRLPKKSSSEAMERQLLNQDDNSEELKPQPYLPNISLFRNLSPQEHRKLNSALPPFSGVTNYSPRWPTRWKEIELSLSGEGIDHFSWIRALARRLNVERWLGDSKWCWTAALINRETENVICFLKEGPRKTVSFQPVSGITLQQPSINSDFTVSWDGTAVLCLTRTSEGFEFSRWPIVLWSPWWARGAGITLGVISFLALTCFGRRKREPILHSTLTSDAAIDCPNRARPIT